MPGGRPRPSVSLAISSCDLAWAFCCASLIAARIRSSTTSLSSPLKIDGSMSSPVNSPFAVEVALTRPAPDSPVTVMLAISSCSSAILPCISCAAFIILPMSPIWPKPLNILSLRLSAPLDQWRGVKDHPHTYCSDGADEQGRRPDAAFRHRDFPRGRGQHCQEGGKGCPAQDNRQRPPLAF